MPNSDAQGSRAFNIPASCVSYQRKAQPFRLLRLALQTASINRVPLHGESYTCKHGTPAWGTCQAGWHLAWTSSAHVYMLQHQNQNQKPTEQDPCTT